MIRSKNKRRTFELPVNKTWGDRNLINLIALINLIMTTRIKTALNLEESCVLLTAFGNLD
ncbi:hypothetical protein PILCRDRAFT_442124 [Piloderma croceum F 1598]|uniref:Uncharacterized protein n=1 Tax=Piloderma croceum (strain F 1598) TaxID=765440 RepID=A0A0C3BAS1_PILCF|nr:hypothetical protein PILCRDRAFT_442124 [Piloderma croceum F 1598]